MDNVISAPKEKKQRSSNLELFRIISMLLIVAHHYVVNSEVINLAMASPKSMSSIYAFLIGAWGKMGINCFVLITGYFMCKSQITIRKFLKLIFEVEFYKIIIYCIFVISGYEAFSFTGAIKSILPFTSVATNFTGCFLLFYLCIPFLNILVKNMNEKMHIRLLLLVGFIYIFLSTMSLEVYMNYVSWYIVLYFIASYIRLYPKKIFESTKLWGWLSAFFVLVSSASVVLGALLYDKFGKVLSFYFLSDSNKILAVATGLSLFMFFKNIKMKNSKFINTVASTMFGVLLIHANSATMRKWLWIDTLKNAEYFASGKVVIHSVISVILVFVVCLLLDLIRILFIEKYYMRLWDKIEPKITKKYKSTEEKICNKLNIGEDK